VNAPIESILAENQVATHRALILSGFIAVLASPFILWLALYVAAQLWSVNLRSTLPWIRGLRWITWAVGGLLVIVYAVRGNFQGLPVFFAIGIVSSSTGFQFPEWWVKRRFAPDFTPGGFEG
jgi:hypothetical protein